MKPRTSRNIALAAVAVILVVTFACCMMIPGDPNDRPVLPVATATTDGGAQARLSDCDSEWTYYYEGRETTATAHKIDPYATYDDDGRGWPAALDVTDRTPPKENPDFHGHLAQCPYFTVDAVEGDFELVSDETSFTSVLVLEGEGTLAEESGENLPIRKGESLFVPAGSGLCRLAGRGLKCLVTRV